MIDLDTFAATLGDPNAPHVRHVALGAVLGAVKRAQALREPVTAYLLHPDATPEQAARYAAQGLAVVATTPGRLS
ncbi:hypothetical protein [Xylanimonas protaetiae]|uniref:Uncharacterized protein n=1 Tax=Xylanimonas protaetiae TaxID=2509457 RepID=A0A4P6FIT2_9MICO|nr:hypothetical protein [Xylanimonas protaetiae]QAY70478.1 hypothetical protein ET471_10925 [Xylanimonas protaetiae]